MSLPELLRIVSAMEPRIRYFWERIPTFGKTHRDVAIVIMSIDDEFGHYLAKLAVGDTHEAGWAAQRKAGLIPVCVGLIERAPLQTVLDMVRLPVANMLRAMEDVAIVVAAERSVAVLSVDPKWQERWAANPVSS